MLVDELESACPLIDSKVADLIDEHTPQVYTVCGTGARSTLRTFKHGLAVTELAVSELPGGCASARVTFICVLFCVLFCVFFCVLFCVFCAPLNTDSPSRSWLFLNCLVGMNNHNISRIL
jgi:hypothetical protein